MTLFPHIYEQFPYFTLVSYFMVRSKFMAIKLRVFDFRLVQRTAAAALVQAQIHVAAGKRLRDLLRTERCKHPHRVYRNWW